MLGMHATTGEPLSGFDHLTQSVADILTTPIGTRVMRRDYGSRLPELIDSPAGAGTAIELFAATAEALDRWEPRFKLTRVVADQTVAGRCALALYGIDRESGGAVVIPEVIV